MNVESFAVKGPLLLTPKLINDDRGSFYESWNARRLADCMGASEEEAPYFVQDNQSKSCKGVLRGLHYQMPPEPQGKLVRCVSGEIFDVAVDIRRSSPTYGQWIGARLSGENHEQLWVPPGFAHGFLTLSDWAIVLYKASGFWNKSCERSLRWNDPAIGIKWPIEELGESEPLLAEKDAVAPLLVDAEVFA